MLTELMDSLSKDVTMGLAQAGGAVALCLGVVLLCRRFSVPRRRLRHMCKAQFTPASSRGSICSSLGLVWIPGVMAGMLVSGASPIYAGIYQFIIVALILAASAITGLIATLLVRSRAFSPAAQLVLRPRDSHRPVMLLSAHG